MRRDIEFSSEGLKLRGWLYKPSKGKGPFPTVVMAHGFSGVKEQGLDDYADAFCKAGLAVLVYDNRCLGASEGKPRADIDPVAQMRDYRSAITFAQMQKECDANRIGIWGTSYTGGTVCAVAGLDKRVKAVVSQVPFMNGVRNLQQFVPVVKMKEFLAMLDEDRKRRVEGKPSMYMKMCSLDPTEPHVFPGEKTYNYIHHYLERSPNCTWKNQVTIRSLEYMLEYDVTSFMARPPLRPWCRRRDGSRRGCVDRCRSGRYWSSPRRSRHRSASASSSRSSASPPAPAPGRSRWAGGRCRICCWSSTHAAVSLSLTPLPSKRLRKSDGSSVGPRASGWSAGPFR